MLRKLAPIAQQAEQGPLKPKVAGSTPAGCTIAPAAHRAAGAKFKMKNLSRALTFFYF